MYVFNLLVSCSWGGFRRAKGEITRVLRLLGDENPVVKPTLAEGIIGVKTCLNSRELVQELRKLFEEDASILQYTSKWIPVDLWTYSTMAFMKRAVAELGETILKDER